MAGYGGAIKNISIGLASSEGKAWIHSGGTSRTNAWGGEQDAFLESMAESVYEIHACLVKRRRIGRGKDPDIVHIWLRRIQKGNDLSLVLFQRPI